MDGPLALKQHQPFSEKAAEASTVERSGLIIDSANNWILLHKHYFLAKSVRQSGGILTVLIASRGSEEDAALQALRSPRRGIDGSIAYAHRNDALIVAVEDVGSESTAEGLEWAIKLRPKDVEYGGRSTEMATTVNGRHLSVEDIAEQRARRILLNDPPPMTHDRRRFDESALLESLIRGSGVYLPVESCIVRDLYARFGTDPALYLRLARLAAIFALKAGDVVERVERLTLGPILGGQVHVAFAGLRRKKYDNRDPHRIEFEGDCPLK